MMSFKHIKHKKKQRPSFGALRFEFFVTSSAEHLVRDIRFSSELLARVLSTILFAPCREVDPDRISTLLLSFAIILLFL